MVHSQNKQYGCAEVLCGVRNALLFYVSHQIQDVSEATHHHTLLPNQPFCKEYWLVEGELICLTPRGHPLF